MVDYNEFVEFHKKHPNMDNAEYYAEFPDVNVSTIRSWKSRARKPIDVIPTEKEAKKFEGAEENEKYLIQMLMNQTNTRPSEFEGVDSRSKLLILKNRKRVLDEEQEKTKSKITSNSGILPMPKPIGSSARKFGIDPYIEFDKNLNEIRMEIPMNLLFDPETNKALRSEIK